MMAGVIRADDVKGMANAGYYIALRLGFAFPMDEVNELPQGWIDYYTAGRFMLHDPVIRWVYMNTGAVRWSEITIPDPMQIFVKAQGHGLRYGVAISCFDGSSDGQRSFGSFARHDREFSDTEIQALSAYINDLHHEKAPPTNVTTAELEALLMVKQGKRLKQIAHELGVSEGAVKQRLKNAKIKLGAKTGAQAATMASQFGLI